MDRVAVSVIQALWIIFRNHNFEITREINIGSMEFSTLTPSAYGRRGRENVSYHNTLEMPMKSLLYTRWLIAVLQWDNQTSVLVRKNLSE